MALFASFASLDHFVFLIQFPQDVLHRGIRFQQHGRVMVLDGLRPFRINLRCDDDCCGRMLVGEGIHFTDIYGLKHMVTLV